MSDRRVIEVAFPLKQASLDLVHEKNVGHFAHLDAVHLAGAVCWRAKLIALTARNEAAS